MTDYALTLFGIQPLAFAAPPRNLLPSTLLDDVGAAMFDGMPAWVAELERLYPTRHFAYRRLDTAAAIEANGLCLGLSAWLCCNTELNQHVVVIEVHAAAVAVDAIDARALRALLVASDDDRRPAAVRDALVQARGHVQRLTGAPLEDILVGHDTCNVALFLKPLAQDGQLTGVDAARFWHDDAERLSVRRTPIEVSDATRVFFGGRAHVVVSTSEGDSEVIRQILFMLQVMWFYVPLYLRHASSLHRQVLAGRSRQPLDELEAAAQRLVNAYQTVRLQNESAKISYEALASRMYQPAQELWAVERSIDQLERYAAFFRGFIKDIRAAQAARADEALNYVLAALGLFGIFGLWANILTAEATAREIVSFRNLVRIITSSSLGIASVVCIALSAVIAVWLVAHGIRTRHARRWRRGAWSGY